MSFIKLIKENTIQDVNNEEVIKESEGNSSHLQEEEKKPEEVLRRDGFKIKLITKTAFGVQIDLAKKYSDEELENSLKDYTIKIKDKSVFIVY
jgi:hypothetical protein